LLVVVDRKQSIYGFRGADVGSFAELCIGLAGGAAREALRVEAGQIWEPEEPSGDFVALHHNRRSRPEILDFVNAYSRARLVPLSEPAELYEVDYAPAIEDLSPPDGSAWHEASGPRVSWIRLPTGTTLTSSRAHEGEAVARRIARILASGEPRVRGLPPTAMDIAVLAQRNGMLESAAYALARSGIPYVVAGNGFFSTREVKDMVAMLSFVVDPGDRLARASVLRGAWCGASDETLVALTDPHAGLADVAGWEDGERRVLVRAEDKPRLAALRSVVLRLREVAGRIGPAETLRQAARLLDFEETLLLLSRGEQRVANVRKVLALAEREPDARTFLARMARATDEERAEPEAATFSEAEDAVRLLTVHASKGLDFPIVLLPEAGAAAGLIERSPIALVMGAGSGAKAHVVMRLRDDEGRLHDTPSFAAARRDGLRRETAERARLAYVAATRAREAVVFVGDRRAPKGAWSETYRSASASALARLAAEESTLGLFAVEQEDEAPPTRPPGTQRATDAVLRAIPLPDEGGASLTSCEREDFRVCPRRFQLKHLLELPEPISPPVDEGAARQPQPRQLSLFEGAATTPTTTAETPSLVEARWTGSFPRAPIATCRSIGCGYVRLCHPESSTVIPPSAR